MTNIQKCGVIGVGFVGATCAYTLAVSGLFSDLVLRGYEPRQGYR